MSLCDMINSEDRATHKQTQLCILGEGCEASSQELHHLFYVIWQQKHVLKRPQTSECYEKENLLYITMVLSHSFRHHSYV